MNVNVVCLRIMFSLLFCFVPGCRRLSCKHQSQSCEPVQAMQSHNVAKADGSTSVTTRQDYAAKITAHTKYEKLVMKRSVASFRLTAKSNACKMASLNIWKYIRWALTKFRKPKWLKRLSDSWKPTWPPTSKPSRFFGSPS